MLEVHEVRPTCSDGPVALVLPGRGYTAQAPLLYWTASALAAGGWRTYAVEWHPTADALDQGPRAFVEAAVAEARASLPADPSLIVGKSLGSFALPHAVATGTAGVWLTPILTDDEIAAALRDAPDTHLAIGGTADAPWRPERVDGTSAALVSVDGADHGLGVGDWRASMQHHAEVVERIVAHAARIRDSFG
ncbi:hypothetical protein ARHIZOSPH14_26070 [Agromyces rhizosphaerae]|uniref:Alpha/beta hydrolase n=1 Tax=Agromyces rhizosphaerae TaxID=88374 RepID=A0A9W6FQB9_9MICO|nr:hypothetical protein [Agromyces rhizosphaerae]GLI28365.1 hypothetical protein ARHIZOSPH14_26070 [Agromyces rhizosphaerae]